MNGRGVGGGLNPSDRGASYLAESPRYSAVALSINTQRLTDSGSAGHPRRTCYLATDFILSILSISL
jgi:hypothetical protein